MGALFVRRRGRRLIWGGGQLDVRYIARPRRILFDLYKQGGHKNRGAGIIRYTGLIYSQLFCEAGNVEGWEGRHIWKIPFIVLAHSTD